MTHISPPDHLLVAFQPVAPPALLQFQKMLGGALDSSAQTGKVKLNSSIMDMHLSVKKKNPPCLNFEKCPKYDFTDSLIYLLTLVFLLLNLIH